MTTGTGMALSTGIGVASPPAAGRWSIRRNGAIRRGPGDLIALPVTLVVGLAICVARSPSTILHPELWAEDGAVWFHDAYMSGWASSLFRPHAGYLEVFPRLLADVGLLVPLQRLPLLFVLAALFVQVAPAVFVVSRRFERVIPQAGVRCGIALAYLLLPNASEVNANLTNAQWHLGLLAVMVVLAAPARRAWKVVDVAVLVLAGLTGPYVIVLVPVALIMCWFRRQRWTYVLTGVAMAAAIAQVGVVLGSSRSSTVGLGASGRRLTEILGGQIVGGTLLGSSTETRIDALGSFLVVALVLAVVGAVVVGLACWRGPLELKLFNLYAGLILAASLAAPVGAAPPYTQWQAMTLGPSLGARYWFFPTVALVVDLIWLAGQTRWWRGLPAALGCVLVVCLLAFGVREDFDYASLPKPDWALEVQRFEAAPAGTVFTFTYNPPGWTMVLTKK